MKVNKKSWHYKIVSVKPGKEFPSDLCSYMRRIFINTLMLISAILIALFFAVFIGHEVLDNFNIFRDYSGIIHVLLSLGAGMLSLSVTVVVIAITIGLIDIFSSIKEKIKLKRVNKSVKLNENVFVAYAKSKKNKYCSKIEFVDEESGE